MQFILDAACLCNTGRVRKNNEDNFFFDGRCLNSDNNGLPRPASMTVPLNRELCVAVFDGMGGENFGELASFAAAERMKAEIRKAKDPSVPERTHLNNICLSINDAVVAKQRELCTERMGSTLVALYFSRDSVYVCNLGDSRAYRLRDGEFLQLSEDHVEKRERKSAKKAPLTQHLGINPEEYLIEPHIAKSELRPGDQYLLCSDGLTDMLSNYEIDSIMREASDAEACAQDLVDAALEKGGRDNVTVIVCRVREAKPGEIPEEPAAAPAPEKTASAAAAGQPQKDSKRKLTGILIGAGALLLLLLIGFFTIHNWQPATCTMPEVCKICGRARGEALGHDWAPGTCTEPETCRNCGATRGDPAGHVWMPATCQTPETCKNCGETRGTVADHDWADATCTEPETCRVCGETRGEPAGHDWQPVKDSAFEMCTRCQETIGENREAIIKNANEASEQVDDYRNMTSRGIALFVPYESTFLAEPMEMTVAAEESIEIFPKPGENYGNLGTLKPGTQVTVFAEEDEFCFFAAEDGRAGWSLKEHFTSAQDGAASAENADRPTYESIREASEKAAEDPSLHYSTVSNVDGYKLIIPSDDELLQEPLKMRVNANGKTSIYIMPASEEGHGDLGKLKHGESVTVLAIRDQFYFFVTEDGRAGWNGSKYFIEDTVQSGENGGA